MLCGLLVLSAAFSSLAAGGGDKSELELEGAELTADAFLDEIMPMSVNDDLADADFIPALGLYCQDLSPYVRYANAINNLSGNNYVMFSFSPYWVNQEPFYQDIDFEFVLTFANGYDSDVLAPISSSSGISGLKGAVFHVLDSSTKGRVPSGFQYVDENTIRISYSMHNSRGVFADSFSPEITLLLNASPYLYNNSVSCKLYALRSNPLPITSVSSIGGGGGEGGGTGGGSTGGGSSVT